MFPLWPSTNFVQAVMISRKTWPLGDWAYISLYIYVENFKNLIIRNHWTNFNIRWHECFFITLYQDCSSRHDSSKNMAIRGQGLFSLYIYIERLKNFLVRNHGTDFNITWQKCSIVYTPLPRMFIPLWFVKKTWPSGGRAYFAYIYIYRKL